MINYIPEVTAFWEKFKDVETEEEWNTLARELGKFENKDPECNRLLLRCYNSIAKRYNQKIHI